MERNANAKQNSEFLEAMGLKEKVFGSELKSKWDFSSAISPFVFFWLIFNRLVSITVANFYCEWKLKITFCPIISGYTCFTYMCIYIYLSHTYFTNQ